MQVLQIPYSVLGAMTLAATNEAHTLLDLLQHRPRDLREVGVEKQPFSSTFLQEMLLLSFHVNADVEVDGFMDGCRHIEDLTIAQHPGPLREDAGLKALKIHDGCSSGAWDMLSQCLIADWHDPCSMQHSHMPELPGYIKYPMKSYCRLR